MQNYNQKTIYNKILGSLVGAGMGDALGAPTELYSIDEILQKYDGFLSQFAAPPKDTFAGSLDGVKALITDDASQMYVLSEGLIKAGYNNFTNQDWIECLLRWAEFEPYAHYKGPTTELVVKALKENLPISDIGRIGRSERQAPNIGTTNGAAMRIAPVGLIYPGDIKKACDLALQTCLPSHDTNIAIASACAIAAATAEAMKEKTDISSILNAALQGAQIGEELAAKHARIVAGPKIEMRIKLALDIAQKSQDLESFLKEIEGYVGNSVAAHESIPCALGILAYTQGDLMKGITAAANVGNDTDSIATMVGAIAGAFKGFEAVNMTMYKEWLNVNSKDFDIKSLAEGLTALSLKHLEARNAK